MKNFLVVLSLIWLLCSCAYNTYIIKNDEFIKDVKHNEVKKTEFSVKYNRDELIQYCQQKGDYACYFLKKYGIEYMAILLQNENFLIFIMTRSLIYVIYSVETQICYAYRPNSI
jgi:hypothetical protein